MFELDMHLQVTAIDIMSKVHLWVLKGFIPIWVCAKSIRDVVLIITALADDWHQIPKLVKLDILSVNKLT